MFQSSFRMEYYFSFIMHINLIRILPIAPDNFTIVLLDSVYVLASSNLPVTKIILLLASHQSTEPRAHSFMHMRYAF